MSLAAKMNCSGAWLWHTHCLVFCLPVAALILPESTRQTSHLLVSLPAFVLGAIAGHPCTQVSWLEGTKIPAGAVLVKTQLGSA